MLHRASRRQGRRLSSLSFMLGLLLASVHGTIASAAENVAPDLVIYTYDSLMSKHGLGPEILPLFEKKCGCKVKALPSGDGGQLLSRLQLDGERGKPTAQIVLGLDQATFERARKWIEPWEGWEPRGYRNVVAEAKVGQGFVPFDYGVFAFIADREALKAAGLGAPTRLTDLLKPEWRRNVILEDPRTSTPGLAFLLYGNEVAGAASQDFWKKFRTQWLTLAPGWDGAYGLFLKKEAPIVWSYTTSQAYHEAHGDKTGADRRYQAVIFEEGQPVQIEGAALVKGSFGSDGSGRRKRELARSFLEFLLSPEVQSKIPLKNWMLPVVRGTELPESFRHLPRARRLVRTPTDAQAIERALADWKRVL